MHQKFLLENSIKQEGKFLLTHRMEKSLQILQLPFMELQNLLQEEVEKNPLLERRETKTYVRDPSFIPEKKSLFKTLEEQARDLFSKEEIPIVYEIIKHIDRKGYLSTSLESLSLHVQKEVSYVEKILLQIHKHFEPSGVGARSLQECLFIQVKRKWRRGREENIIRHYFSDLLHKRYNLVQKALQISKEELVSLLQKLASLSIHPGSYFFEEEAPSIRPDIAISQSSKSWKILVHQDTLISVPLDINKISSREEKKQIRAWQTSGNWLIQSLERRKEILQSLALYLLQKQHLFFQGKGNLLPMTMKEVAKDLHIHESTLSRAVYEKYVECSRGIFALRSFFSYPLPTKSGSTTQTQVLQILQKIIEEENNTSSDECLSQKLQEKGLICSRRTVTKYRKKLKIPSSRQRAWTKS